MIAEIATIKDFENYKITNDGRVLSCVYKRHRWLTPKLNSKGYYQVTLRGIDGTKSKLIHRLVAEQYVLGDKNLTVNHKDGNKLNNRYSNLEWVSFADNMNHALENRLHFRPRRRIARVDLTTNEIIETYPSIRDAERSGFFSSGICVILSGKRRKHGGFKWIYV